MTYKSIRLYSRTHKSQFIMILRKRKRRQHVKDLKQINADLADGLRAASALLGRVSGPGEAIPVTRCFLARKAQAPEERPALPLGLAEDMTTE